MLSRAHSLFLCYLQAKQAETSMLKCFGFYLCLQQFARHSQDQPSSTQQMQPQKHLHQNSSLCATLQPVFQGDTPFHKDRQDTATRISSVSHWAALTINCGQKSWPVTIDAVWLPTSHRPLIPHQQFHQALQLRLRKQIKVVHRPFFWPVYCVRDRQKHSRLQAFATSFSH